MFHRLTRLWLFGAFLLLVPGCPTDDEGPVQTGTDAAASDLSTDGVVAVDTGTNGLDSAVDDTTPSQDSGSPSDSAVGDDIPGGDVPNNSDTVGDDTAAPDDTSVDEDAQRDLGDDASGDSAADLGDAPVPGGWLYTQGNGIFESGGGRFHGRGANIHETRSCNACAWAAPNVDEVNRRIDALVDDWNADFMRLLVESYATADGRTHWITPSADEDYLADIRTIVDHIGTKDGVYVLLSLWIDPSFDGNGWPTDTTNAVWEVLVREFAFDGHVLFGLVNEPESNFNGNDDANVWARMDSAVAAIRAVEAELEAPAHVITVQGTRAWARDLTYYIENPITAGGGVNIAYETHAYDPEEDFDVRFEIPSQTLPVIIGEFGPGTYTTMEEAGLLMTTAEALEIPYLAWTFHMRCPPNLLVENSGGGCGVDMDLEPTEWGTLLMNRLSQPYGSVE